jgi:DNA-binding transcriptional LysR family regulator
MFRQADIAAFADVEPFDAIVGRLVLEFLPDPAATIKRLCGLLHSGGILAFQARSRPAGHLRRSLGSSARRRRTRPLHALERTFTIRANDGFVEAVGAKLVVGARAVAPGVGLCFTPKPDKDVRALREGGVDLEIGVFGDSGPEIRIQPVFRDRFVGVVRKGHPLLDAAITPQRYAACEHVVASRRGVKAGPVDRALAELSVSREVIAVVPSFSSRGPGLCRELRSRGAAAAVVRGRPHPACRRTGRDRDL